MGRRRKGNESIQVVIRARPLNKYERSATEALRFESDREIVVPIVDKESNITRSYRFDQVFNPQTRQFEIYQNVVMPFISEALMGYNCTIFAYGQTGTGKTYTMEGRHGKSSAISWQEDPQAGIVPRTLHQLFDRMPSEDCDSFEIYVSFMQLYNEDIYDLLDDELHLKDMQKLKLYGDGHENAVHVEGLQHMRVDNREQVQFILDEGAKRRVTATTKLNDSSSRSHTVFTIVVKTTRTEILSGTNEPVEIETTGKLNFVDLAGSESIARSGAVDKRAYEAGKINQSLLTLGRVITALIKKDKHVPYRESKLTRILQDSLGGASKACIIATVSPADVALEETVKTLDFAYRAKDIQNKPEINAVTRHVEAEPETPTEVPAELADLMEPHPSCKLRGPDDGETIPKLIGYYQRKMKVKFERKGEAERAYQGLLDTISREADHRSRDSQKLYEERRHRQKLEAELRSAQKQMEQWQSKYKIANDELRMLRANSEQLRTKEGRLARNQAVLSDALRIREDNMRELRDVVGYSPFSRQGDGDRAITPGHKGISKSQESVASPVTTSSSRVTKINVRSGGIYPALSDADTQGSCRAPSPPPKPSPAMRAHYNTKHRRSRSVSGRTLDHQAEQQVPSGTIYQPILKKSTVRHNVEQRDLRDASNYVLRHQEGGAIGGLKSTLFKGDVIPTAGGGSAVVFHDAETLQHITPGRKRGSSEDDQPSTSARKRHRN